MNLRTLFNAEDRPAIEKWCREHTQQAYLGDHTALCRVLGKFLMYVDTRDLSLTPHLLMDGYWEMWVTQAIVSYVKPGMRCIDVGANVGYYTLLLSDLVGDKGMVVAYEPAWAIAELLKKSILVNGARADVLSRAASDHRGREKFFVAEEFGGSGSLKAFEGGREIGRSSSLQSDALVSTIDEDLIRIPVVDFVKIDAQGSELEVLRGMKLTIARSPGIAIAMEFSPAEHSLPQSALEDILDMGLRIQTIGTDGEVRPIALEDAAKPDTGDHRMLWLTRA